MPSALATTKLASLAVHEYVRLVKLLADEDILVHADGHLGNTSITLAVEIINDTSSSCYGKLCVKASKGETAKAYTAREGKNGLQIKKIAAALVKRVAEEHDHLTWQLAQSAVGEKALVDASHINKALGLEAHHFPRVVANHKGVPLSIISPLGLTAEQARAALAAIVAHAPPADAG